MKHYTSPFSLRYASKAMSHLFSPHFKHLTWRKLWIALAKAQKELGLPISGDQITALEKGLEPIDFEKAAHFEKIYHHDVMAHIHAYAEMAPAAKGIIHLGATSCYVTDNTDLIQMKEGLVLLLEKLKTVLSHLATFAKRHADLPTLSYTHLQPAQPTTVGKRACLWLQDLIIDYHNFSHVLENLKFLGLKGATGTQSSFLNLFEGDASKVDLLEQKIAHAMGFTKLFTISGQTYTRKQDISVMSALSSFAASLHKFATDLRLLSHLKEVHEPFAKTQVGSSAMPHKKNPIYAERICAISRFLISLQENAFYTEATQWLERSLDDSANRRLYIPEAFLAADSLLELLLLVTKNLETSPSLITAHLSQELPFLITEQILMTAVKKGKNRQDVHEALREHSHKASALIQEGKPHTLLQTIANDPTIGLSLKELEELMHSSPLTGRASSQVAQFIAQEVDPLLK